MSSAINFSIVGGLGTYSSYNGRYHGSASSISGTLATIVYGTKDFDSQSSYNNSTGVWTCPYTGKYQFNVFSNVAGTFVLNSTVDMQIQQAGSASQVSETNNYSFASATSIVNSISDVFSCVAGDTIKVQVSSNATAPSIVSSATKNWISWCLVGS